MSSPHASAGKIAALLQPFVDHRTLAGAVTLVADREKVLEVEAVGFADLEARKPMAPDTFFWIASMAKPVCATAFMMLVDEGLVKVEDPVEKYLPEFKGQMVVEGPDAKPRPPSHPILVREVLSHTSGLPFQSAAENPTLDVLPLQEAVECYAATPLLCDPGTKYIYSNAGTNTAARIIEVVSGSSYVSFLNERLLGPLGMRDTTFFPNEEQLGRLAKSYKSTADGSGLEEMPIKQLKYPLNDPTRHAVPAGGLFSTAGDLVPFCQMILEGGIHDGRRYLSEAAIRQMSTRATGNVDQEYGFCWGISADGSFHHGGAHKTFMGIYPRQGLVAIFLIQHGNDWPTEEGRQLMSVFTAAALAWSEGDLSGAGPVALSLAGTENRRATT